MTAAEINARAIMDALKTDNPTLAQIETALRMIRVGDLVHVDLIPAWQAEQTAFDASDAARVAMGGESYPAYLIAMRGL